MLEEHGRTDTPPPGRQIVRPIRINNVVTNVKGIRNQSASGGDGSRLAGGRIAAEGRADAQGVRREGRGMRSASR
jgi:hypothetical protein